ncbi:MAG: neutral/alkaline non-lysosomal ceramidase N-terminal domain-containing protein [Chryseolinea sp.]
MGSNKFFRIVLITISICSGLVVIIMVLTIAPLNRDPNRTDLLHKMRIGIDSLRGPVVVKNEFAVGFAKVNLTPAKRTATAGYGKRLGKLFTSVHDSIYVRTLVVGNGINRVAIVSADLLIIPPTVTALLEKELPSIGFTLDNTFLGAIHSHNSIGNWGKGAMALLFGGYDDAIVRHIADRIKQSIRLAAGNIIPAKIQTGAIPVSNAVVNRLIDDGPVDSLLRVISITRRDSSKLLLMNFTAHATCLSSGDLVLSRDYPGKLVDTIEASGFDFAMFMAGPVGSQSAKVREKGWPCVEEMTATLSNTMTNDGSTLDLINEGTLWMKRVPFLLAEPQVKVFRNWRIRSWLFNAAFGDYPEHLTVLRIGHLVMVGAPCDISGEFYQEIDKLADKHGIQVMISSFNGAYIGYVTPTKYYDEDHYETQLMSWYGPGNAEYMLECMERLIDKAAATSDGMPGV